MKKLLILTLCCFTTTLSFAQQNEAQENKLVQFHLVIFSLGPKAGSTNSDGMPIIRQHIDHAAAMVKSGKAVIGGSILDADNSRPSEVVILRTSSAEEAKSWIESDPAIKAGLLSAEIHPWWSEDIFRKDVSALKLERLYLGFLQRGPNRKEGDGKTPEVQELQKAHIANINRLAETKKLVVAGPIGDNGDLRGIFVFRVGSLKEAQDLAATDPMIKIDRLRLELYAWWVQDGVIP